MKRNWKVVAIFALLSVMAAQVACTSSEMDEVIADLQLGVDAASVAAPLVLAAFAPGVAAPVANYLALANQVFGEIAQIAASQQSAAQKAAGIATAIAALVAQNPGQILPTNAPPQLVAEVGAVANAAKAVAGLFPPAGTAANVRLMVKARTVRVRVSASETARFSAIAVQAQANLAVLAARK
jgi:phage-related protein